MLCERDHLPVWVNCSVRLHTHFCGWRELFPDIKHIAIIARSRRANWYKYNWLGHWMSHVLWNTACFFSSTTMYLVSNNTYQYLFTFVVHTLIFCYSRPGVRQGQLWIFRDWELVILAAPSFHGLFFFSFFSYISLPFCDLISSHAGTCECLSAVCPPRNLWSPRHIFCFS